MKLIRFSNIKKLLITNFKASPKDDTKSMPSLIEPSNVSRSGNQSTSMGKGQQKRTDKTQDPPPAYTPTAPVDSPEPHASSSTNKFQANPIIKRRSELHTDNNPYAFLEKFDTVFLIDDSGSMWGRRWKETQYALSQLLGVVLEHDQDGVDFYFINHQTKDRGSSDEPWKAGAGYRNVTRATGTSLSGEQWTVEEIFSNVQPSGGTLTGMRLDKILSRYLGIYEEMVCETDDETCLRPLNIIVITDGEAQDHPKEYIVPAAQRLGNVSAPIYQVGIQFFQVGNDHQATESLRVLDDELSKTQGCRDIVDMIASDGCAMTGERLLKALQGGVDKHWDKKKA